MMLVARMVLAWTAVLALVAGIAAYQMVAEVTAEWCVYHDPDVSGSVIAGIAVASVVSMIGVTCHLLLRAEAARLRALLDMDRQHAE